MRILIISAIALTALIGAVADSHPHGPYISQIDNDGGGKLQITKRKDKNKDAFYGSAKTQAERYASDSAHQARLATKSEYGFITDLQLAGHDIIHRLSIK